MLTWVTTEFGKKTINFQLPHPHADTALKELYQFAQDKLRVLSNKQKRITEQTLLKNITDNFESKIWLNGRVLDAIRWFCPTALYRLVISDARSETAPESVDESVENEPRDFGISNSGQLGLPSGEPAPLTATEGKKRFLLHCRRERVQCLAIAKREAQIANLAGC